MATYKQLQDQIKQLQHEAEELRKNELSNAIAQIKMTMAEYMSLSSSMSSVAAMIATLANMTK